MKEKLIKLQEEQDFLLIISLEMEMGAESFVLR